MPATGLPAIGFGQKVTGGGSHPTKILRVTSVNNTGKGTLAEAIATVNGASTQSAGYPAYEIVIATGSTPISANTKAHTITARNLTIRGTGNAVIERNQLAFDCRTADNIILQDLRFISNGNDDPRDAITIDGTRGRGGTGFWIDRCVFQAYFDLSITTNTRDLAGAPPLLITISHCRFYDDNPNGAAHKNHGAIGIHGTGGKTRDKATNAYATVCRNVFSKVRRRSPRSSHLTVVHAFNNVLLDWGTNNVGDEQANGMESGHFGILLAGANYFSANVLKETVSLSADSAQPARFTNGTDPRQNVYVNGAKETRDKGDHIFRETIYREGLRNTGTIPIAQPMTDTLRDTIQTEAPMP
jgi:pectate lyase